MKMSRYSSLTSNPNNNTNNINNYNQNHLNTASKYQRRGIRRRWEIIRRTNQSVENNERRNSQNSNHSKDNDNNRNHGMNNNGRNSIGEINQESNINIGNNQRNSVIPLNRGANDINIHNHNNYNIINNFNNYDLSNNSINPDSCFIQFRRIRKNYLDRQNFINNANNNLNNNISPISNTNSNNNNIINISLQNDNSNSNNVNIEENNNINNIEIPEVNNNNIDNNQINNEININNNNNIIEEDKKEIKNEIKEDKKDNNNSKREKSKDENIGSEIKDTVKCYICFEKITKPKMCPHCHRMACEKCLYNWFINLKKDKCGFCRLKTNYKEMISVPFMDAVVNFVEQFFYKKKIYTDDIAKEFLEYCPEHENELLYYYCLDCGKAYCKTCFVFFGEEKDKHVGHSIIEYEKYKNMSLPLLKKNLDKLESNIQHVEENIQRCISYKNSYEHQRQVGNNFLNNLQDAFNNQMDKIILSIDDHIKKLKDYINEYNKYKKDIDAFYGTIKHKKSNQKDKSCESLIIKLTNINQHKFFSSKDIEKLSDLSKNFYVNTYQSKVGEFNHENIFLSRGLKMGGGPCEIVIDNKQRDEVLISLNIPKNKFHGNHNFKGIIFIRKKGECMQSYDLDEYVEDYNFYYLKKKIPWDFIGSSIFKLKGILYDFYFS